MADLARAIETRKPHRGKLFAITPKTNPPAGTEGQNQKGITQAMKSYTNSNHNSKPFRSTAAQAGPRAGKPPAKDEREFVLPLMRTAGPAGINRNDFLKGSGPLNGRQVTQVGRLIHQLEKEGYVFKHERRESSQFIFYVLVAEPNQPRQPMPPQRAGWRSETFRFGAAEQQPSFVGFETGVRR